ncbi:hypothetical protein UZ36_04960 [Candidatus Nitromaritima sp. SCGC AAA799-C22]|nr:hypothetical protein UZ36_04960 [Candidatus Nitromaritima sp. SCGC AAA799-C22]
MAQDRIRIGVIGAGQNTKKMHLPGLLALPDVVLTEVANRSAGSGEKAAKEFGIRRVRSNWKEVATSDDVDAVVIGTWPYLHCEASCAALSAGKHVLCEARMAMNVGEARRMLETSQAHPRRVAQLVPAPFTLRTDRTIQSFIRQGRLGDLLYFQAEYQSNALASADGTLHWRRNKKFSGENTMVLGILYESLMRWLPPAKSVSATGSIFNARALDPESGESVVVKIPDYLSVQMCLENGMHGSMLISEIGLHAGPPTVKIFGTEGTLQIDFVPDGKLWYGSRSDSKLREVDIAPKDAGHWRVEEEFINAIRGKEEVQLTTFTAGVAYMRFTQAAMDSYRADGAEQIL